MSIDRLMVSMSPGLHSKCFSKDRAFVVGVERLASLARTEVPFLRLFLAGHHFETCRNCVVSNWVRTSRCNNVQIMELNIRIWRCFRCCSCFRTSTSCTLRRLVRGCRCGCRRSKCWWRVRGFRGRDINIGRAIVRCRRWCHCDGSAHGD